VQPEAEISELEDDVAKALFELQEQVRRAAGMRGGGGRGIFVVVSGLCCAVQPPVGSLDAVAVFLRLRLR
jgi:hypothetical protein